MEWCTYAIGYDESRSYKILRFVDIRRKQYIKYEIYDLKSDSWKCLDDISDWFIWYYARGVSVKGNTYWFALDSGGVFDVDDFLICFDFTIERFGPRLPLPFHSNVEDTVTLSSVREEQLAVLFQRWDTMEMEVWVTAEVEPRAGLWNKLFLAVDMEPIADFHFGLTEGSFFVDEKKKIVVVFVQDNDNEEETPRNAAYIIGEDGYFRKVDLGHSTKKDPCPLACSYVPSSVHIKQ